MAGAALAVVVAAALAAGIAWRSWTGPGPEPCNGDVEVRIPGGATVATVADSLVASGLLEHRDVFRWGCRLTGADRALRAGLYHLPRGASPRTLARLLVEGRAVPVKVTMPEGLTVLEAATVAAEAFPWKAGDLVEALDREVEGILERPGWLPAGRSADGLADVVRAESRHREIALSEGYLFPETYHFDEATGPERVAAVAAAACLDTLAAVLGEGRRDDRSAHLTPHEILVLASIVEAETPRRDEMPRVAAVYLNRLSRDHPLEADPTVAFVLDKRGKRILYRDLETDSEYNTYRVRDLPPGPIGAPGADAIRAVVAPDPDRGIFYFVADGRGGHVFSRTWAEHEQAVSAYRARRDGRSP